MIALAVHDALRVPCTDDPAVREVIDVIHLAVPLLVDDGVAADALDEGRMRSRSASGVSLSDQQATNIDHA